MGVDRELVSGGVWPGRLGFGGSEYGVTAFSSSNKLLVMYGVANIGPDGVVENNSLSTILLRQICFVCHSYMMSLKTSCTISQISLTVLFILYLCSEQTSVCSEHICTYAECIFWYIQVQCSLAIV